MADVVCASSLQFSPTIPNNTDHFAVGDITAWSGIKRVGRALYMGQCAAVNILQLMAAASKQRKEGEKYDLYEYPEVPPMMALALGSTAVTYHPSTGVSGGAEAYKTSFGTDLGLSSKFLNHQSSILVIGTDRYLSLLEHPGPPTTRFGHSIGSCVLLFAFQLLSENKRFIWVHRVMAQLTGCLSWVHRERNSGSFRELPDQLVS